MLWYYVENGKQTGPVDDAALDSMARTGLITPDTHVWREGMPDWVLYRNVAASGAVATVAGSVQCAECGNFFLEEDIVQIGDRPVCATCKPIAVQKLREGVIQPVASEFRYAGFWMRFLAVFVDGLVMIPVTIPLAFISGAYQHPYSGPYFATNGLTNLLQLIYSAFFIGRFGSTLGMMACGIRVVRPNGDAVSYLRAIGRYFASILGFFLGAIAGGIIGALIGLVFGAATGGHYLITVMFASFAAVFGMFGGYLIVVFDGQKRAFHDYLCDTRVVYKS